MPIYINGQKVKAIYASGQSVNTAYSNGELIFSTKQGWEQGLPLTLTINPANNNSISGTMTFYRYDYYDGGAITETYYQVARKELSRTSEGIVTLNLGAGTAVVFGNAASNADYNVPTNGTIRLSASELNSLFRIRKANGVLNLGTSLTVTSNYLEPVQDMAISQLGSDLYLTAGWAISSNRTSRIKTVSAMTVSLQNLSVPKEGTWPVYAVASAGTEVTTSSLTCSTGAHYSFDAQNIRHLGWVTVSAGNITNVISINTATGSGITKSISGSTLTVNAGYATDTDGCKVYIPKFTYSFSDMITAAKDVRVPEKLGSKTTLVPSTSTADLSQVITVNMWETGHFPSDASRTSTTQRLKFVYCDSHSKMRVDYYIFYYAKYKGVDYTGNLYQDMVDVSSLSATDSRKEQTYYMPKNSFLHNIQAHRSSSGTGTGTAYYSCYYNPVTKEASVTPGKTRTRNLYVKVTRNQNNNSKTTATQTSTGDSSPYVSYIFVGTITVTRNSSTGTIS
jgi:hypothetical protein